MKPIGSPSCSPNGSSRLRVECAGEQRVVAHLGVRVQRKVIGGKADVRIEQDLQAALERGVDRTWAAAPEEPVMDDQQIGLLAGGQLEQLGVRRDARCDGAHLGRAGNLKAVGTVVLKARGLEQPVDLGEDVCELSGHWRGGRRGRVEYWQARRGVAQPGSAHRSGR